MLISTCSKYIFLSSAGKMGFGDNQAIESAQTISTRNIPVCNCGGTNSKVEGEKETAIRPLFDERVDPLNWVKAAWKLARSHVEEVKEMVEEYERSVVVLDGSSLSIGQVAAVARGGGIVSVKLDSEKAKEYVDRSVEWICQHLLKGTDIYGVTTGFGANSHRRTTEGEKLQQELIRFLNAGILGDENQQDLNLILPVATTRAAMLVRTNTLMQGYSGHFHWSVNGQHKAGRVCDR
ncbi:hypothetical protein GOP47_0020695 [Adiantum capillus-veneris]|uniref:Phenylalanine ammonia-lyase n=1 Tax=Adiantum capillus-veneris TaxID=13818 RepID=A0A9D4U9V9_ADICA|nr:hypothetical protein GOP47_0020695 [Adiantum capillus-veneris]